MLNNLLNNLLNNFLKFLTVFHVEKRLIHAKKIINCNFRYNKSICPVQIIRQISPTFLIHPFLNDININDGIKREKEKIT